MDLDKDGKIGSEFNDFGERILENYDEFYRSMGDMINYIGSDGGNGQENILGDVTSMATAIKNCFLKVLAFLEDGNLDKKGLQTELDKIKISCGKFDLFEKMDEEKFMQIVYSLGKERSKGFLRFGLVLHKIQNIDETNVVMSENKYVLKSLIGDIDEVIRLLKS